MAVDWVCLIYALTLLCVAFVSWKFGRSCGHADGYQQGYDEREWDSKENEQQTTTAELDKAVAQAVKTERQRIIEELISNDRLSEP